MTNNNFNVMMDNFTSICQRYTDVMAHKYYLQNLIFSGTKFNDMVIKDLTLVIIKLQLMASILQTAQVCVYSYIY